MNELHIGNLIRHLMVEKKMTQKEVGDKVSLTSQGVGQVLTKESVQLDLLERFMRALDVNIYEILSKKWRRYDHPDDINTVAEDFESYQTHAQVDHGRSSKLSNVSLLINVDESKKDEVLKLLLKH